MEAKMLDAISLTPLQVDPSYFFSMVSGKMLFTRSSSSAVLMFSTYCVGARRRRTSVVQPVVAQ
jgi:hypothetical protein